jgi:NADH:ubiquinone oxidoreductase subunit 2 (subunit N)
VLYAVLGAYYYLRIANAMLIKKAVDAEPVTPGAGMWVALGITGFATVAIGILPQYFIDAALHSVSMPQMVAPVARLLQ